MQPFSVIWIQSYLDIWYEFYNDTAFNYTRKAGKKPIFDTIGNYFIHESQYIKFNKQVIHLTNLQNNKVLISWVKFDKIQSNDIDNGGVIHQNSGSLVQYRVCSISPAALVSFGSHSFLDTTEGDGKNYFLMSSISNGFSNKSTISHNRQDLKINQLNVSNCYTKEFNSALDLHSQSGYENLIMSSTFYNNTTPGPRALYLGSNDFNIKYCNFISNNCSATHNLNSIVYSAYFTRIDWCIFKKNIATNLVSNTDARGSFIITNTIIASNTFETETFGANISITRISSFDNYLPHIQRNDCQVYTIVTCYESYMFAICKSLAIYVIVIIDENWYIRGSNLTPYLFFF